MGACFLQMTQDFSNGVLFKDEGDDAESAPTFAFQRVGEIDPSDELCPTLCEGGPLLKNRRRNISRRVLPAPGSG